MQPHRAGGANRVARGWDPKPDSRDLPSGMWLAKSDQETPRITSFRPTSVLSAGNASRRTAGRGTKSTRCPRRRRGILPTTMK